MREELTAVLFTWLGARAIVRLLNSWSRDSCTLLTTSSDFTAVLWDVLHGTVLREVQCNTMVLQGSLNPRNRCRASSLPWHPCCLARVFTNSCIAPHTHTHTHPHSEQAVLCCFNQGPFLANFQSNTLELLVPPPPSTVAAAAPAAASVPAAPKAKARPEVSQHYLVGSTLWAAKANDSTSSPCFPLCVCQQSVACSSACYLSGGRIAMANKAGQLYFVSLGDATARRQVRGREPPILSCTRMHPPSQWCDGPPSSRLRQAELVYQIKSRAGIQNMAADRSGLKLALNCSDRCIRLLNVKTRTLVPHHHIPHASPFATAAAGVTPYSLLLTPRCSLHTHPHATPCDSSTRWRRV